MIMPEFPIISVKGTPFECGQQYGTAAGKLIHQNVDRYLQRWQRMSGTGRSEILKIGKEFVTAIGEYDSDILHEINGIAKGAELSLEEVVTLNARYEISSHAIIAELSEGGCTSAAAQPEVTKEGHTIIGQNWDLWPGVQGLSVILEVVQGNKPSLVTITEAGVVAHRGMNSAGVASCFNALKCSWDTTSARTPFMILARGILSSDSVSQALKAITRTSTTASGNFLIAHRDGIAVDLEVTPRDVGVLYAEGGIFTHSNHFLELTNRQGMEDEIKHTRPDTLLRFHRARQLLESAQGQIDIENFKCVFRDHSSYPNSICRHVDNRDDWLMHAATLSSVIMDLDDRVLYVANGNPCENGYYRLAPEILQS